MNGVENQNPLGNPIIKSKSPILFTIFTLLLLTDGLFTILGSFPALLIGGILAGGIFIIIGVGKIIVAIGLRKMKNWALYGFTIIVILMIIPLFGGQKDLITILTRVYEIIILVYFWYIFKKQVSKIWILAILIALIAGGFLAWQYFGTPKEERKAPEELADETTDWKTYKNEEYGFEFNYPKKEEVLVETNIQPAFEIEPPSLLAVSFHHYYEESPFQKQSCDLNLSLKTNPICYARFFIDIKDKFFVDIFRGVIEENPPSALEKIKEIFNKSEYVIIGGVKGVRRNEFIGLPPGGGGAEDVVWLPKNSELYRLYYIIDKELLGTEENAEKCLNKQQKIFNQMLSTFKFLE